LLDAGSLQDGENNSRWNCARHQLRLFLQSALQSLGVADGDQVAIVNYHTAPSHLPVLRLTRLKMMLSLDPT
jgi:hypothetical protein